MASLSTFAYPRTINEPTPGGQIRRADDAADAPLLDVIKDRVKMAKFKNVFDNLPSDSSSDMLAVRDLYQDAKADRTGQRQKKIAKLVNATVQRQDGKLSIKPNVPYVEQAIRFYRQKFYTTQTGGALRVLNLFCISFSFASCNVVRT